MGKQAIAINGVAIILVLAVGLWSYLGDQRTISDLRQTNQSASDQLKLQAEQLRQAQDKNAAADAKIQTLGQQVTDSNKQVDDTQKKLTDALAQVTSGENANNALTKQVTDAKTLLDASQKKVDDSQASNKALSQKLDLARQRFEIFNDLSTIGRDTQAGKNVTQESIAWLSKIDKLNDPKLNQLISAIGANPHDQAASSDMVTYLLGSIGDSLK